jgi:hypothetical protein
MHIFNESLIVKEEVKKKNLFAWILFTALLTGVIDILFAFIINYKTRAAIILKFIASGVFGKAAFGPGTAMVYYGLLIHFCIATAWTIIFFFLLYPKLSGIIKSRVVLVILIGIIIWLVMNLVVVPLSRTPSDKFHLTGIIINTAALIVAYGLPFTIIANKFYNKPSSN